MSLTPEEIQQQKFKTRFRGFDVQEVESFLNEVAENFLALMQENTRSNERLAAVEKQYEQLLQEQQEIQATIDSARNVADELKNKGRQEAEALIARAREEMKAKHEEIDRERAKIRAEKEKSVKEAAALIARAKEEIKAKHEEVERERAKIEAEMAQSQQEAEKLLAGAHEELKIRQQDAEAKLAVSRAEIDEFNVLKAKIREELRALLSRFLKRLDAEIPASAVTAPFASDSLDIVFETDDESEGEQGLDEEILMQLFQGVDLGTSADQEMTNRPVEDDDLSDLFQSVDLSDSISAEVQHSLKELNEHLVTSQGKPAEPAAVANFDQKSSSE
jgi:cell division initiation protein